MSPNKKTDDEGSSLTHSHALSLRHSSNRHATTDRTQAPLKHFHHQFQHHIHVTAMNPLLFLYLNLIRGPRLLEERRVKEEAEMVAKIEQERAEGKTASLTCKKCDGAIDVLAAARARMSKMSTGADPEPKCGKCAAEERAKIQAEVAQDMKMTPFLWFQLFVMCAGILVFVHRNVMPLM